MFIYVNNTEFFQFYVDAKQRESILMILILLLLSVWGQAETKHRRSLFSNPAVDNTYTVVFFSLMQKALDKTYKTLWHNFQSYCLGKKLWYLRLCLIANSCHKTVHKLKSCIFLFVCFFFFKPWAYTDCKNVFSLQLSWYSTIGDSHAFNFLSMKRLQNKKLHVPFVEQQKSGIMS